jgi:hypothetical protein
MSKQTAIEWYENEINALIRKYENQEISKSDFIVMRHNLFYPAKAMEKEQIEKSYTSGREQWQKYEFAHSNYENDVEVPTPRKYYNETYGGDK